jgi:hypothetical protein
MRRAIPLTGGEVLRAHEPLVGPFLDPESRTELSLATMRAFDAGREEAFFAPVIDFAVRVALRACTQPQVQEKLPAEVDARAQTAAHVAEAVARGGIASNLFIDAYRRDPILRRGLRANPVLEQNLRDVGYISTQCAAPFPETARIAGGAWRALRKKGVNRGQTDIISRSRSILLAASIPKQHTEEVFRYLGTPYASPGHFQVGKAGQLPTVDLSPRTIDYLHNYLLERRGCAAASINPRDGKGTNMLRRGFGTITAYLLDDGAEVSY